MAFKKATRTAAEILLVEDNPSDIRLMQEAFREAGGDFLKVPSDFPRRPGDYPKLAGDPKRLGDLPKLAGDLPKLNVARNGPQALAFLRREAPYQASPRPSFILLDLNLPGADGSELLAEIKKDRVLRQIPVIVFSTSTRAEDIARAYELHANCFISKPRDLESLVQAIRSIQAFWLGMAAAPDATPQFRLAADQARPLASSKSA